MRQAMSEQLFETISLCRTNRHRVFFATDQLVRPLQYTNQPLPRISHVLWCSGGGRK